MCVLSLPPSPPPLLVLPLPLPSTLSLSITRSILTLPQTVDNTLQKKAYKALQQLLSSDSHAHKAFVQEHLRTLTSTLMASLSTSSTASKKVSPNMQWCMCVRVWHLYIVQPRLQCLMSLVEHIGEDGSDFIAMITPEVSHVTILWCWMCINCCLT